MKNKNYYLDHLDDDFSGVNIVSIWWWIEKITQIMASRWWSHPFGWMTNWISGEVYSWGSKSCWSQHTCFLVICVYWILNIHISLNWSWIGASTRDRIEQGHGVITCFRDRCHRCNAEIYTLPVMYHSNLQLLLKPIICHCSYRYTTQYGNVDEDPKRPLNPNPPTLPLPPPHTPAMLTVVFRGSGWVLGVLR